MRRVCEERVCEGCVGEVCVRCVRGCEGGVCREVWV